jgi:acyl-CoA thioester hydrolase
MTEPYRHRIDVRYLEVDRQGVVFNMWYLAYFDDAIAGYLDHRGLSYPELMSQGYDVMLVHTELDWTGGVGFGDQVAIEVRPESIGRTSFTLGYTVLRAEQQVCQARTVYVLVAVDGSGKVEIPDRLRRLIVPGGACV